MKKPKIWKATDDERLLAESGKIYRVGFGCSPPEFCWMC